MYFLFRHRIPLSKKERTPQCEARSSPISSTKSIDDLESPLKPILSTTLRVGPLHSKFHLFLLALSVSCLCAIGFYFYFTNTVPVMPVTAVKPFFKLHQIKEMMNANEKLKTAKKPERDFTVSSMEIDYDPTAKYSFAKMNLESGRELQAGDQNSRKVKVNNVSMNDMEWSMHRLDYVLSAGDGHCLHLKEAPLYYPPSLLPKPSAWLLQTLRKNEIRHKKCVANIKDWPSHFEKPEKGKERCRYLVWLENSSGLGNRLVSILSAFLYSLLTKRVLLIDTSGLMDEMLCDPFPNSAWFLSDEFPMDALKLAAHHSRFVQDRANDNFSDIAAVMLQYWYAGSDELKLFFCDHVQNELVHARWLSYESDQYLVPGLYLIPKFRRMLKALFPKGVIMPYLARYLLHPKNKLWEKITRIYNSFFIDSDVFIGMQVRTFSDFDPAVNQRLFDCLKDNNILPKLIPESEVEEYLKVRIKGKEEKEMVNLNMPGKQLIYSMFVTSLDVGYYEYFKQLFSNHPAADGSIIRVYTESHEIYETHDLAQSQQAMVEIWLLSMSHTLLQSYHSTFGYVAKALASRESYIMNICDFEKWLPENLWRSNSKPVCEYFNSSEGCFHSPPFDFTCANSTLPDYSPLKPCVDVVEGLTL